MSNRVYRATSKNVMALAAVIVGAAALSGCTALGGRSFSDQTMTGSTAQAAPTSINQSMPSSLGAPPNSQVAQAFLPPANVGGGPVQAGFGGAAPMGALPMGAQPSVTSQTLPVLSSSPSTGNQQAMPMQQTLAPVAVQTAALGAPPSNLGSMPVNNSIPQTAPTSAASAPQGTYTHTIASGESLYTIARRYDVTTQALVQANALSSPDRIVVGQRIIVPGRSDLLVNRPPAAAPVEVATASPIATPVPPPQSSAAVPDASVLASAQTPNPASATPAAPVQMATAPQAEPALSGAGSFRWPASGRIITDFAASRGTGINIELPEGTAVKAAENGTVIYTGSGVEGYGNLVLVRHPNGYVSAYAHLQSIGVAKGAVVNRGDNIGAAGMTGSVTRPQLHFELRKGATPVDPVPLLAS